MHAPFADSACRSLNASASHSHMVATLGDLLGQLHALCNSRPEGVAMPVVTALCCAFQELSDCTGTLLGPAWDCCADERAGTAQAGSGSIVTKCCTHKSYMHEIRLHDMMPPCQLL